MRFWAGTRISRSLQIKFKKIFYSIIAMSPAPVSGHFTSENMKILWRNSRVDENTHLGYIVSRRIFIDDCILRKYVFLFRREK